MNDIAELRKAMQTAQVAGKGQYILNGRHELDLSRISYKKTSFGDGTGKESIICEFKVASTTCPEMAVGETRSVVFNFEKKGWLGRFKPILFALIGVDPYGRIPAEAEAAVMDLYVALRVESERQRLQLDENLNLAGTRVSVEGFPGTIKTGPHAGKPITELKWAPSAQPGA